jgi:alpha-L-rhamnosidase
MKLPRTMPLALALGVATLLTTNFSVHAADDPFAWPPITSQTKPWAFNWWMGSAVDKTNLTHELERYAAAGLGGIHIIPIYGAKGFESKYINYLSPEWMEMMGWTVSEANRLGMGVDMTTGTGWCFGGPQVTDEDANASVVVKTYDLAAGEKLKEKFNRESTQALVAFAPDGKSIELTGKISANGEVDFSPPSGKWTVYAISQKPSGQKVKRPAPGGEGWMLNLIYPPAMDDFLKPYTAAFANYHGPKPRAQYHDSYEYKSDWSPNFFAEFEKRRGYKLQTELPTLFPDSRSTNHASRFTDPDHRARVLCDYRQTVSEIMAEESLPKWTAWAHSEGFITRDQAHGSPGNWLDLYATADIPETEFFSKHRNILVSKFASSAAHVKGGNLVSSESGTWLDEHFTETLAGVKYLMDDLFLSGVNHVFYHGCCYSPDEAGWPGWHFYAATEMNPRNSIWHDAPAVNAYIARVQSVLQSGQSDNDILLYWPIEDFWMQPGDQMLPQLRVEAQGWFENQPIGKTAHELWNRGYAFDYVSDAQLKTAKVAGGKIQMPGGNYKVIVVPECKFIPLKTFNQLLALAKKGATVIFEKSLPKDVSGFADLEKQRMDFKSMVETIKPKIYGKDLLKANIGKGGFLFGWSLAILDQIANGDQRLTSIRRVVTDGRYYFIVNHSGTNFDDWLSLADPAKSVVEMDPMTGRTGMAKFWIYPSNMDENYSFRRTEVYVQLAAGESIILRTFADKKVKGPAWNYWHTKGQPVEITGQWNVKFILGGPTLPSDFQTAQLASWTTFPDTNTQAFAGTAKYTLEFNLQVAPDTLKRELQLDLGDVRQSARVRVNGKDYGTLITPPFRVVVDNLTPVGNTLEVEVTSVAANRIRDLDRRGVKWKTFRDINFVDINYKPFDASNWPLTDCGLLGPVTLTPVTAEK